MGQVPRFVGAYVTSFTYLAPHNDSTSDVASMAARLAGTPLKHIDTEFLLMCNMVFHKNSAN